MIGLCRKTPKLPMLTSAHSPSVQKYGFGKDENQHPAG